MRFLLATVLAVRGYKQHKADKASLEPYKPALANLDLAAAYSENETAYLQQQAKGAYAPRPAQRCCGRQYRRDCTTCGRANASNCHQRKCYRRQRGRGCCGGGDKRRQARQIEAVRPVGRETEVAPQEEGVTDPDVEKRDGGFHVDNKSLGGFKASEKEVEASDDDDYGSQVEEHVELPPYKG